MDNLNVGSDESIQKKIPKIIINGIRCQAVLTNKRIVLVERENNQIYKDIPYAEITLAVVGVNAIHEPVLTIHTGNPEGDTSPVEIVFVYQPGGQNVQDLERCVALIKGYEIPVQNNGLLTAQTPRNRSTAVSSNLRVDEGQGSYNPASDRTVAGRPWQFRQAVPDEEPKSPSGGTFLVVLVVIAMILGGAFMMGQVLKNAEKTPDGTEPVAQPAAATPEETTPPPAETMVAAVPAPAVTPTTVFPDTSRITSLPQQGIWAKISYPGNYIGSLGGDGRRTRVNSSGTQYIALPFQNTTIDGSVEKRDGSADLLEVEIYNGGTLITKSGTRKPFGIAEIHAPVGLAMGYSELPTPAPPAVVALPTPDPSLAEHKIPPTGVWVRVAYPGTFSGSIGSNGDWREVHGSGDQFYQIPMTRGVVEGSIEKSDLQAKNMVVGVYKDGTQVFVQNTTLPRGIVKIYTAI